MTEENTFLIFIKEICFLIYKANRINKNGSYSELYVVRNNKNNVNFLTM